MNRIIVLVVLFFLRSAQSFAQSPELRGIWMTPRNGSGFWTKAELARAMDSVANANFNVVYFNAWSRGWPLWRSDFFFSETGYYTDPAAGNRDILQEAIAEAHRRGLEIEAWMEYGFVGWWSGNNLPGFPKGPLFARHPDWTARKRDGNDEYDSGSNGFFYWMVHNRADVQQWLIRLHTEIARKYDVDGIELDRIRYPQTPALDCGYDSASVAQYQAQYGIPPPQNISDPQWMRWRADKLNAFHRAIYDSIKATNANVTVSNAPSHYSSGTNYPAYENVLQDWRAWLNTGKLDAAQIQMYVQPPTLAAYIPSAISGVQDTMRRKCYAGVAPKTTNYTLTATETIQLITTARNAGLRGTSFWYYTDLIDLGYFGAIRSQAYQTRVAVPDRRAGWRDEGRIQDDTSGNRSSGWININLPGTSSIVAWNRNFSYVADGAAQFLDYRVSVPANAYYEVYVHQIGGLLNLTTQAPFELFEASGASRTILLDQSTSASAGWYKLGDAQLAQGSQRVVRLTNANIGSGKFVAADAIMLVLNRRLSPNVVVNSVLLFDDPRVPSVLQLLPNYPNPFNPMTNIVYQLPTGGTVKLDVFDTLGKHLDTLLEEVQHAGSHAVTFHFNAYASGVYLVRLQSNGFSDTKKILLLR